MLEEIRKIAGGLPHVTEDIKWEDHLCFNIGGKMFLITSPDTVPVTASFKVTDEDFELLSVMKGFKPAPYLARYKWIYVDDVTLLSKKQWEKYVNNAYKLIASKLSATTKKQFGLSF